MQLMTCQWYSIMKMFVGGGVGFSLGWGGWGAL